MLCYKICSTVYSGYIWIAGPASLAAEVTTGVTAAAQVAAGTRAVKTAAEATSAAGGLATETTTGTCSCV